MGGEKNENDARREVQRLFGSLPQNRQKQVSGILADKDALRRLLDSPKARELSEKLKKQKTNG